VARTWLQIQVDLLGGGGTDLKPPPGRILIVGPSHTFEQFADAINQAFARWDLSHLHEFELSDGRRIGFPSDDFAPEMTWEDHAKVKVCREVKPGDEFTFTFDFGDNWRHLCTVGPEKADPIEQYGEKPVRPVAIWGWGSIPDQYGRTTHDG
jgi:Plasmid pRiA4b ORF-3-like protein